MSVLQDKERQRERRGDRQPRGNGSKRGTGGVRFPSKQKKLEVTRNISTIDSRSINEIIAMWGDEHEEQERREKLHRDLDRIELLNDGETSEEFGFNNSSLNESGLCTLGLIDKVGERADQKIERREQSWDAVLWNQHDQLELNEDNSVDYDEVAKAYTEQAKTYKAQKQAQNEAIKLSNKVQRELQDDDDDELANLLMQSKMASESSKLSSVSSSSLLKRTSTSSSTMRSSVTSTLASTSFRIDEEEEE